MNQRYVQPAKSDDFYRQAGNALNELLQKKLTLKALTATSTIDPKIDAPDVLLVSAASGAVIITLPGAAVFKGGMMVIKKTDASANTVTVDGAGAELIEGAANVVLAAQWASVMLVSDGTGWIKV